MSLLRILDDLERFPAAVISPQSKSTMGSYKLSVASQRLLQVFTTQVKQCVVFYHSHY